MHYLVLGVLVSREPLILIKSEMQTEAYHCGGEYAGYASFRSLLWAHGPGTVFFPLENSLEFGEDSLNGGWVNPRGHVECGWHLWGGESLIQHLPPPKLLCSRAGFLSDSQEGTVQWPSYCNSCSPLPSGALVLRLRGVARSPATECTWCCHLYVPAGNTFCSFSNQP